MRYQRSRRDAPKKPRFFYLSDEAYRAVRAVLGPVSFSAFAASAVLREAERVGASFYGEVRGGRCARAAPARIAAGEGCSSELAADWWNRAALAFYCESCARAANAFVSGICAPASPPPRIPPIPGR